MTCCHFCVGTSALSPGVDAGGSTAQGVALVPEAGVIVWRDCIPSHCLQAPLAQLSHLAPGHYCSVPHIAALF